MLSPNASLIASILCSIPFIRRRTHRAGTLALVAWNGSVHGILVLNYNALPLTFSIVIVPEPLLQPRRELASLAHGVPLSVLLIALAKP